MSESHPQRFPTPEHCWDALVIGQRMTGQRRAGVGRQGRSPLVVALQRNGIRVGGQEHPAVATDVVDSTGAGDALAAGFIVGGAQLALETAARCVARVGAMP